MKSDERILELPRPIIDRLREVIGRIRRLQWIKGSLFTLAAAVAAVLALIAVDAAFSLEALWMRLALSGAALAFTIWIGWTQWLRPLSRKISLTAVARWVETRHPELQERISTAVELLDSKHGTADQGSRELLEAVVQDAVTDVSRMDPAQELSTKRTRPAKWLAGAAVAALLAIAAIWPNQIPRLLVRALAPMADVGNAWADRLRVLTQSQVVATGDPLSIEVARSGGNERVELHMTAPDGTTVIEMLTPDAAVAVKEGESGYALRMPAVRQGFTARVVAGKAVSAAFTIKVVDRPEPGSLTLTYDYPNYSGLADEVKPNASGEISALAGTRVTVTAPLNRAVAKASVKIGELDVPGVKITGDANASQVEWNTLLTPNLDALWTMHLEDEDGIANRPVELPIRAVADLAPVITLDTPTEDRLELRPVEKLALTYSVREDIGLSAVQIRIRPQERPEYLMPAAALPDKVPGSAGEYAGTAVLDLAKVMVPDGQEIRVSLMAADVVPADLQGPQRGYSREIVIKLNRWTRPRIEKNFEAQHQELRRDMEEVKQDLQHARGRMNDKPDRLKQDEKLDGNTLKDLEDSAQHMAEAQEKLEQLSERMKQSAYARQTPDLENIAREMVKPAQEQAREIPLTDQKEERSELARNSKELLEKAIQKLEEEQRRMDQSREAVQQIAKLSDIAEQQQRLAQEAADAANPQQAQSPADAADSARTTPPPPDSAPEASTQNATGQGTPPTPPDEAQTAAAAPTPEEQKKWLEEQRQVAERAKQLTQENQNANPQALQEQLKQAAEQAAQLAGEAEALAEKEKGLAAEMATAASPEKQKVHAAAQEDLANQVAALEEKARGFQEASATQIDQSTETQEAAHQARSGLEEAAELSRQSGKELMSAAQAPPVSETPAGAKDGDAQPQAAEARAQTQAEGQPPVSSSEPLSDQGHEQGQGQGQSKPEGQGESSGTPTPAAGQQAAEASAKSLAEAAAALKSLGGELNSLAGMVGEHNQSLAEGAQQAGTAVDQAQQARDQAGKEGQSKGMQEGAQAAQQAADRLSMAANTAMQAMSIPASAKSSQASSKSKGKGKGKDGQPQPAEPGQEGKDGLQLDTASSALPAELAKLGLTQDDWMKLRSSLNGVDSTRTDQIPAEYRELVKAYFGALAKGGNAK